MVVAINSQKKGGVKMSRLEIVPLNLKDANVYVSLYHRHNRPVVGHKFSIGVTENGCLCGVAICGRPVARKLDCGFTLEIYRVCTNGVKNVCSMLYGACARISKEMGYTRIITYTLRSELGTSLKASGFRCVCRAGGLDWNVPARKRLKYHSDLFGIELKYPDELKYRWEKEFKPPFKPSF